MCMFMSQLPRKSKSNGQPVKKRLALSLKPCPDNGGQPTWYRVRLLAWTSPEKNDRDDPFIERFVHQVWKKNDKGYNVVDDEVVCPVTKHVHVEGNRYDACPICGLANQHFVRWKESGWKDREAARQNRSIGRKYEGIVPVYVKDDPNTPANNGTFKAIIFHDKKKYAEFRDRVAKASQTNCVFNGANAVDCCLHVSEIAEKRNEGQPNEYVYTHREIDKIVFTTKPYDIPSITKEWVLDSGFDEEYYVSSTPEELRAFYNRHYKISNDDIPLDEDMVQPVQAKLEVPPKPASAKVAESAAEPFDDPLAVDIEDLVDSVSETTPPSVESNVAELTGDADVDELLKDLELD